MQISHFGAVHFDNTDTRPKGNLGCAGEDCDRETKKEMTENKDCKECVCTHSEDEHFKILRHADDMSKNPHVLKGIFMEVKFKPGDCKICNCEMYERRK